MYDYYNYPQMQLYEESDDSEESENKIKNLINNDGFQHVTYVGINELYNQPIRSRIRGNGPITGLDQDLLDPSQWP